MNIIGAKDSGISRVAVCGAGPMGSGIAALFANAGIAVDLLDLVGDKIPNARALAGVEYQRKAGGFMGPMAEKLVTCGTIEDDLQCLAEADWIVEAVSENLDIKRDLYARIDAVRKAGSIVSSNTSTISLAKLVHGMSDDFARNIIITHFFNPPRAMRLVEIVATDKTDPEIVQRAQKACRALLGKTVVKCRDTPGFIANRIGCFWMAAAALEAKRMRLDVELADAVHATLGMPRTGVFGLFDLVGIDLVPQVWGSLGAALPLEDALHSYDITADPLFAQLIAKGRFGRKTGMGFYRENEDGRREALDLSTGEYRALRPVTGLPAGGRDIQTLLDDDSLAGEYANRIVAITVGYSASHLAELGDDAAVVDTAIELGYAWKYGPFALADRVGLGRIVDELRNMGQAVPPAMKRADSDGGFYRAGAAQSTRSTAGLPVHFGNEAATLHDLGDGVACLRIHTKMNSFAPEVFDILEQTLEQAGQKFSALVLGNDDPRAFSAGADLSYILRMSAQGEAAQLDSYIARGQRLFLALRYAQIPVVAAAHGFALGGGCEFMLHAHAVVAHCEINAGLPETKVGLIPAWGGCTTLLARSLAQGGGPAAAARRAFDQIFPGQVNKSALEARTAGLLRASDQIAMHRADIVPAAKAKALELRGAGHAIVAPKLLMVGGPSGKSGLLAALSADRAAGRITATDYAIGEILAELLTGGPQGQMSQPLSEEEMMALERAALMQLVEMPATRARMEHMLKTGRALRN
ncbi:MAG: enoyl-CoA hydratase/isomerase family protein [Rhodobacteraceae bacterium]|nr:enoyl-CoA hydratase/isomerase family protein [Paracoccaceae bacterium]PHR52766.1 MAG: 3-hydroxyacyl-CoA dehydrogenase [Robiginitomaculum sp.]